MVENKDYIIIIYTDGGPPEKGRSSGVDGLKLLPQQRSLGDEKIN